MKVQLNSLHHPLNINNVLEDNDVMSERDFVGDYWNLVLGSKPMAKTNAEILFTPFCMGRDRTKV
jgi:hypothetical protein